MSSHPLQPQYLEHTMQAAKMEVTTLAILLLNGSACHLDAHPARDPLLGSIHLGTYHGQFVTDRQAECRPHSILDSPWAHYSYSVRILTKSIKVLWETGATGAQPWNRPEICCHPCYFVLLDVRDHGLLHWIHGRRRCYLWQSWWCMALLSIVLLPWDVHFDGELDARPIPADKSHSIKHDHDSRVHTRAVRALRRASILFTQLHLSIPFWLDRSTRRRSLQLFALLWLMLLAWWPQLPQSFTFPSAQFPIARRDWLKWKWKPER